MEVAVGSQHTLALSESGNLYGWGKNSHGEVDRSGENVALPKMLQEGSKQGVIYIVCGMQEVCGILVCVHVY